MFQEEISRNSPKKARRHVLVEGRRAGGMDDEDLLLKTAGAQGVSKTSKSSKKPEQGHLLLVVSLFETYSQPTADSGQERINPLLTASSFEL